MHHLSNTETEQKGVSAHDVPLLTNALSKRPSRLSKLASIRTKLERTKAKDLS